MATKKEKEALKILEYALEFHDWCEMPLYYDTRCNSMHSPHYCDEIETEFMSKTDKQFKDIPCQGCKMKAKAVEVVGW